MGLLTNLRHNAYWREVKSLLETRLKMAKADRALHKKDHPERWDYAWAAGETVGDVVSQLLGNTFLANHHHNHNQLERMQRRSVVYFHAASHLHDSSLEFMDGDKSTHGLLFYEGLLQTSKGPDDLLSQVEVGHVIESANLHKIMPFMCYVKHYEAMKDLADCIADDIGACNPELGRILHKVIE